ncbi:MAG: hypothetical protein R2862_06250 [Thermoanaerobaculia bacterium]
MTGLYFGWGIHDRDFPYLVLLAVGTPLVLLAIAGATRLRSRWSREGLALAGCGLLLAFGRHDPLYRWLFDHAPGFGSIRYPEKFALLTLTAFVFVGAVTWRRILDEREHGPARTAELPFALATLLTAVASTFALLAHRAPALVESFLRSHSGWLLPPALIARAADYLRGESRFALCLALSCVVLFALARWSRLPRRALEIAALILLVTELWTSAAPLVHTMPARDYLAPPAVAEALRPGPGRLFSNQAYRNGRQELVLNTGNVVDNWARAPFDRLHSRTANLLGKSYALDGDFDLTFTPSAARALAFYERLRDEPDLAHRLLGAWGVDQFLIGRAPEEILDDLRRGVGNLAQVRIAPDNYVLPQIRFVAAYRSFVTSGPRRSSGGRRPDAAQRDRVPDRRPCRRSVARTGASARGPRLRRPAIDRVPQRHTDVAGRRDDLRPALDRLLDSPPRRSSRRPVATSRRPFRPEITGSNCASGIPGSPSERRSPCSPPWWRSSSCCAPAPGAPSDPLPAAAG